MIEGLLRRLAERMFGPRQLAKSQPTDPRLLSFARGLAIGALIGAAIAGSSIWRRRDRPRTD